MELYLVRHAQTTYNQYHRMQGSQIDSELSEKGFLQAGLVAERLKNQHFDLVLCSPMKRTRQTLQLIMDAHCSEVLGDSVEMVDNLKERDWGSASGMLYQDVDFENLPADAETRPDFAKRVLSVLEQYYEKNKDSKVLVVTHAGLIRNLLEDLFGFEKPSVYNVSVTVFKFCIDGNHKLIMEPCNAHLDD